MLKKPEADHGTAFMHFESLAFDIISKAFEVLVQSQILAMKYCRDGCEHVKKDTSSTV